MGKFLKVISSQKISNRLRAFPMPEKAPLFLIQGRNWGIEAKIENPPNEGSTVSVSRGFSFQKIQVMSESLLVQSDSL
jgi:hypothetical protein